MRRLILFLIRRRLGLGKYELFKFSNQKSKDIYYFDSIGLHKLVHGKHAFWIEPSTVSLNWILSSECGVVEIKESDFE